MISYFGSVSGYAFVYFEDERDARDAIRALDHYPFGYDRRKLSVEWAKVSKSLCYLCFYMFYNTLIYLYKAGVK